LRRGGAAWALAFAFATLAGGCSRDARPNLVLVTLDTTRADRLGAYGDAAASTPNLDALAAEGVVFERAYASAPLTLPSHTTMLTGLDPNRHGVHDNGQFLVPISVETATELLAAAGYSTAAFVAAFVLGSQFGLDQGFAVYDDDVARSGDPLDLTVSSRPGGEVTDRALAWLRGSNRKPFFLWVHYYDVHMPRRPPAPFDALPDAYAGALSYVDAQVGRLREHLRAWRTDRETLLLVVADHGESLGEHGEATHGVVAYDSTLHVPLIAVGPGFARGERSQAFVTTADVGPTLLAAAGLPAAPGIDGRSLQALLGGAGPGDRVSWYENYNPHFSLGWSGITGVRAGRWKLTLEPDPIELFDVVEDPHELVNRATEEASVVAELRKEHARLAPSAPPTSTGLSAETAEQLAALGYTVAPQRFEPGAAPDPRKFVQAHALIELARARAMDGHLAGAIQALELLAESPIVRVQSLITLALAYAAAGRTADSVRAAEQLVEASGTDWARHLLVSALLRDGRPDEALATLEAGGAASGPSRQRSLLRAQAYLAASRPDDAWAETAPWLTRDRLDDEVLAQASRIVALRDAPADAIAWLGGQVGEGGWARLPKTALIFASMLQLDGRLAEARAVLEALGTEETNALAALARLEAEAGNRERALALYEAALAARPSALAWRRQLADLYGSAGRHEAAIAEYDQLLAANPANAKDWLDRGTERLRAGQRAPGEADLRKALALDAGLPEAHFNLGILEAGRGRARAAEEHFLAAVELRPDYVKAHLNLARIYRGRHDPRSAAHIEAAARASRDGASAGPRD
jgi:arylsulfatase A-like enzyme/Flp pilus assembly protein TadD